MNTTYALIAVTVVVSVVAALAVLSARRREKTALRDAARTAAMRSDFVSMVSHELRTPLTSITGFAMTLSEMWQDLEPGEVDEFLGIMIGEANHLEELVEDILVIPRLDANRLHLEEGLFDISILVHEISSAIFPADSVKDVDVAIPGGVQVFADRRRVAQVLRNLMDNARKYGGDQVLIEGANIGEQYMVVVTDNGRGIPEEDEELIFRHFEQVSKGDSRKEQGIGLGLPIARRLARAMGGDVWYERRFPTGSRFCFSLSFHPPDDYGVGSEGRDSSESAIDRQ